MESLAHVCNVRRHFQFFCSFLAPQFRTAWPAKMPNLCHPTNEIEFKIHSFNFQLSFMLVTIVDFERCLYQIIRTYTRYVFVYFIELAKPFANWPIESQRSQKYKRANVSDADDDGPSIAYGAM